MIKKILLIFILTLTLVFSATIYYTLNFVSKNTSTSLLYFPKLLKQIHQSPTLKTPLNFIILGLDPRNDEFEKTQTTDTIMYANLTSSLKLNLVSIPRDLWSYPLKTKVNQVYQLSIGQSKPFDYIQSNYSDIIGQKIDRTVIVTTQNLIDLVKLVGGIDVYLENGFKDQKYPNPEYIKNPSPKVPIYITVEYPSGLNHLTADNITPFVRSRKSAETATAGGTDLGRIIRQQLLIDALVSKIKNPAFYQNYRNLFALYNFFHTDLKTNLTDADIFSLGLANFQQINNFSIHKITLPAGEDPKTDIIYHPQTFINLQWVFIPQDIKYQSLHQFINQAINGTNYPNTSEITF